MLQLIFSLTSLTTSKTQTYNYQSVCSVLYFSHCIRSEVVATTTAVILYTIFIHGGLTVKALDVLGIETGVDDQAVVSSLPKVTTSAAVNWEHKYIYPLVIRGYNDPEFDDPYKPKSDGIASMLAFSF